MRLIILLFFTTSLLSAQMKVLHYDETTGYDHGTRSVSFAFFQSMETELGIDVTQDSNGSEFTMTKMQDYDLIIFSNTSGNSGLNSSQQEALEWFIDTKGGGLLGIHAASDTYRHSSANGGSKGTWDWYAETMGGSVQQGPNHTSANHVNQISEMAATPATENLNFPWQKQEEYYYWQNGYLNNDMTEVLRVGDTGGNSYDDPRPVAWQRTNAAGSRIFYTSLGHKTQNFTGNNFPQFKQLVKDATAWAVAANQVVPVEISHFEVEIDENRNNFADIQWRTSSEINSFYFEVEKSNNLISWYSIAKVSAAGNSSEERAYSTIDRTSCDKICYYRLKSVDLNGSFEYSEIEQIKVSGIDLVSVHPNPASDITLVTFKETIKKGSLRVINVDGTLVSSILIKDTNQVYLDFEKLPSGVFYVEILAEQVRQLVKVVKL